MKWCENLRTYIQNAKYLINALLCLHTYLLEKCEWPYVVFSELLIFLSCYYGFFFIYCSIVICDTLLLIFFYYCCILHYYLYTITSSSHYFYAHQFYADLHLIDLNFWWCTVDFCTAWLCLYDRSCTKVLHESLCQQNPNDDNINCERFDLFCFCFLLLKLGPEQSLELILHSTTLIALYLHDNSDEPLYCLKNYRDQYESRNVTIWEFHVPFSSCLRILEKWKFSLCSSSPFCSSHV